MSAVLNPKHWYFTQESVIFTSKKICIFEIWKQLQNLQIHILAARFAVSGNYVVRP